MKTKIKNILHLPKFVLHRTIFANNYKCLVSLFITAAESIMQKIGNQLNKYDDRNKSHLLKRNDQ